jgi:hypothetical protein
MLAFSKRLVSKEQSEKEKFEAARKAQGAQALTTTISKVGAYMYIRHVCE